MIFWLRLIQRIMPWSIPVLAIVWLLATSVPLSDTGLGLESWLYVFPPAIALCLAWFIQLILNLFRPRNHPARCQPEAAIRFSVVPLVLLLVVLFDLMSILLWVRVQLSDAALQTYAHAVLRGDVQQPRTPPRHIGLFTVDSTLHHEGTVWLTTVPGCGFRFSCGLTYSPHGSPPTYIVDDSGQPLRAPFLVRHITGPWWLWRGR